MTTYDKLREQKLRLKLRLEEIKQEILVKTQQLNLKKLGI